MKLLLIAAASFMLALSGALVPGPLFTLTVSESAKRGFRAGPLIILGHGLLEFGVVILFVFGAADFLVKRGAEVFIFAIGGILLIVMGIMLIRDARSVTLDRPAEGKKRRVHPVLIGILGSISNPYWVIWWFTIGFGYLLSSTANGMAGVIAFFTGHVAADLLWYSGVSLAVSRGRRIIGNNGYRILLYGCGIFLLCFGGWFLYGTGLIR